MRVLDVMNFVRVHGLCCALRCLGLQDDFIFRHPAQTAESLKNLPQAQADHSPLRQPDSPIPGTVRVQATLVVQYTSRR